MRNADINPSISVILHKTEHFNQKVKTATSKSNFSAYLIHK